jgi:hypothetical protein
MMKDLEQVVADLADDAVVVEPAPHPYLLSLQLLGAATLYLAVSLALTGFRTGLAAALGQTWFSAEIVALIVMFAATAISASLLAFPDLHQKRGLALAPLWAFALFLVVLLFAWIADTPPAPLPVHSFECTLSIGAMTLLPATWTIYAMRRFASTHIQWAGAIAVLSAFSVGALWLRLHEDNDSIAHVIEWHYLPMLAAGLLGFWLGKRLLRW